MKKISKFLTAALLLGASLQTVYAQNLNKHIDNASNVSIDFMPSNEYILGGRTEPSTVGGMSNQASWPGNLPRIQLEKLDFSLNNLWFKTYAMADEVQVVQDGQCQRLSNSFHVGDVKRTQDDGFIICGEVRRDPETSGCGVLANYDNMFLLKTDASGNVQWFKRYDDLGMLYSVVEAPNGDFITCGYLGASGLGNGLIIYTDPSGNVQWSKESQTPPHWAPDGSGGYIGSLYYEVINFQGNFAVVGISNTMGTVWGGTLVTIVDASGSYIQNAIIDNENYGYTMTARAIADAGDGDVVITGMAGAACQTGAQIFVLKIEPINMAVNFLRIYSYNNWGDVSWGNSIATDNSNRIFVTGNDMVNNGGGAVYLETDYGGNLNRYTVLNASQGGPGLSMTFNPNANYPLFSGLHAQSSEPTFIVKNNVGYDCDPAIDMPDYSTPYEVYPSTDRDPGIRDIDDYVLDFDMSPIENVACGGTLTPAKGGTTNIKDNKTIHISLSPNPASDYIDINIDGSGFNGGILKVSDITGRVLTSTTVKGTGNVHINTATLLPGMYMLTLEQTNGTTLRNNFVKN